MRPTERLHQQGQSLWLDNITRRMLDTDQITRYIRDYAISGLTSNPSIFDLAIQSGDYDPEIRARTAQGLSGERLFFELAIEDLQRAADLFRPIFDRTDGVDGWVSLEVSPLLAHDAHATIEAARALHERAGRPNLFIKIPGTAEGRLAIEETVLARNGLEALRYLETNPPPDLILLDVVMPVMDGAGFVREQQSRPSLRSIPTVLLSAKRELRQGTTELAVTGSIPKPIQMDEFLTTIGSLLSAGIS